MTDVHGSDEHGAIRGTFIPRQPMKLSTFLAIGSVRAASALALMLASSFEVARRSNHRSDPSAQRRPTSSNPTTLTRDSVVKRLVVKSRPGEDSRGGIVSMAGTRRHQSGRQTLSGLAAGECLSATVAPASRHEPRPLRFAGRRRPAQGVCPPCHGRAGFALDRRVGISLAATGNG